MNPEVIQPLFANTWSLFLIILLFGGSIFVHELGHFLAAKKRGLKIERFSIGFGPKIISWNRSGIEYCISLLPIGGYVALPQLAELGAVEGRHDQSAEELPPISFTDKLIVAVMGAVFNIIFAFVISSILWGVGQPSSEEAQTTVIGHVGKTLTLDENTEVEGPAFAAGLRPGDRVLAIDDQKVSNFSELIHTLITGSGRDDTGSPKAVFAIERDGRIFKLDVFPQLAEINPASGERLRLIDIRPAHSLIVKRIEDDSPASRSGLKIDDQVLAIDGIKMFSLRSFIEYLIETGDRSVVLTIDRNGDIFDTAIEPEAVAFTKPLGKLTVKDIKREATLTLQPIYRLDEKPDPANPSSPSVLTVHHLDDPTGLVFSGISSGDRIQSVSRSSYTSLASWVELVNESPEGTLSLIIERENETKHFAILGTASASLISPQKRPMIGAQLGGRQMTIYLNPIEQFTEIIQTTLQVLGSLVSTNSDIGFRNLSGPPGIIRAIDQLSKIDIRLVLWFVCLLNINLAILNLLPIPVLDGGHIAFATLAKIRGRPLPPGVIVRTQGIFMLLLFSLIIYVSFFDIRRWQGDNKAERQFELQNSLHIKPVFSSSSPFDDQ